ncbi:MAG TPA: hypothetical protein VGD43_22055 [Micromonospora sp.]
MNGYYLQKDEFALAVRARTLAGATAKLRLIDSTELTGILNGIDEGRIITMTVATTVWTVPLSRVLAIANGSAQPVELDDLALVETEELTLVEA